MPNCHQVYQLENINRVKLNNLHDNILDINNYYNNNHNFMPMFYFFQYV